MFIIITSGQYKGQRGQIIGQTERPRKVLDMVTTTGQSVKVLSNVPTFAKKVRLKSGDIVEVEEGEYKMIIPPKEPTQAVLEAVEAIAMQGSDLPLSAEKLAELFDLYNEAEGAFENMLEVVEGELEAAAENRYKETALRRQQTAVRFYVVASALFGQINHLVGLVATQRAMYNEAYTTAEELGKLLRHKKHDVSPILAKLQNVLTHLEAMSERCETITLHKDLTKTVWE